MTDERLPPGSWYAESPDTTKQRIEHIRSSPPPTPDIGGVFYPGQTHTLVGKSDAGKSLFMALIARDLINTGEDVLWIDHEQGAPRVLRRLMDFGATDEALVNHLWRIHYPLGLPPPDALEAFAGVKLGVIDAITGVLASCGFNSNADTEVELAYAAIMRPLAEQGASVVTIDHMGHLDSKRPRGSQRKTGAVDVELLFKAVKKFEPGQGGRASITIGRDRDGAIQPCEFVLASDSTWRIELQHAGGFRPTTLMQRVSEYLEAQYEPDSDQYGPVSRSVIERDVKGGTDDLRDAVDKLIEEGHVEEILGPRNGRLCRLIRPFRVGGENGSAP